MTNNHTTCAACQSPTRTLLDTPIGRLLKRRCGRVRAVDADTPGDTVQPSNEPTTPDTCGACGATVNAHTGACPWQCNIERACAIGLCIACYSAAVQHGDIRTDLQSTTRGQVTR